MMVITNVKNDVPMSKEELEKRIRDIEKRLKELEYKHAIIGSSPIFISSNSLLRLILFPGLLMILQVSGQRIVPLGHLHLRKYHNRPNKCSSCTNKGDKEPYKPY